VIAARNVHSVLSQLNLCLNLNEIKTEAKSKLVVEVFKSMNLQMRALYRFGVLVH
jgi:hypothetical protein